MRACARWCSPVLPLLLLAAPPAFATCGGGGGGGGGGMGSTPGFEEPVYPVPWKLLTPEEPAPAKGLIVYWFPSSPEELKRSSLRHSRVLSVYASQCVAMEVAGAGSPIGQKLAAGEALPVAVLTEADGTPLGRAESQKGYLKVGQVEALLRAEMKRREEALERQLDEAKAKAGDGESATALLQAVWEERCLFPKKAKDAAKELKKLGASVGEKASELEAPVVSEPENTRIGALMQRGLDAENGAHYEEAARLYAKAHDLDPADPAPLRYLGELERHHTGEWEEARAAFERLLGRPADPLSRAVALHGLGKMTIHEGQFQKGLSLLEEAVAAYPLALAYRNLAVYWNSEGDAERATRYVREALRVDPDDPYTLVFSAVFLAQAGHADEALRIARENETLLPASYNLAAIHAQSGDRKGALRLLRRHFYAYERSAAVRAKEMMEARVDAVFASLRTDPAFLALTAGADGRLPFPQEGMRR